MNLKEGRAGEVLFHFVYQNGIRGMILSLLTHGKRLKCRIAHAIDAREILPSRTEQT